MFRKKLLPHLPSEFFSKWKSGIVEGAFTIYTFMDQCKSFYEVHSWELMCCFCVFDRETSMSISSVFFEPSAVLDWGQEITDI